MTKLTDRQENVLFNIVVELTASWTVDQYTTFYQKYRIDLFHNDQDTQCDPITNLIMNVQIVITNYMTDQLRLTDHILTLNEWCMTQMKPELRINLNK